MHAFVVFVILALMLICRRIYDSVEPFTNVEGATGATGATGSAAPKQTKQTNPPKQSNPVEPENAESQTSSLKYSSLATSQRPYEGINYFN